MSWVRQNRHISSYQIIRWKLGLCIISQGTGCWSTRKSLYRYLTAHYPSSIQRNRPKYELKKIRQKWWNCDPKFHLWCYAFQSTVKYSHLRSVKISLLLRLWQKPAPSSCPEHLTPIFRQVLAIAELLGHLVPMFKNIAWTGSKTPRWVSNLYNKIYKTENALVLMKFDIV